MTAYNVLDQEFQCKVIDIIEICLMTYELVSQ